MVFSSLLPMKRPVQLECLQWVERFKYCGQQPSGDLASLFWDVITVEGTAAVIYPEAHKKLR